MKMIKFKIILFKLTIISQNQKIVTDDIISLQLWYKYCGLVIQKWFELCNGNRVKRDRQTILLSVYIKFNFLFVDNNGSPNKKILLVLRNVLKRKMVSSHVSRLTSAFQYKISCPRCLVNEQPLLMLTYASNLHIALDIRGWNADVSLAEADLTRFSRSDIKILGWNMREFVEHNRTSRSCGFSIVIAIRTSNRVCNISWLECWSY